MAKHSIAPKFSVPLPVRQSILLVAAFTLIFSLIMVFVQDGSRAYAGTGKPIHDATSCSVSVTLPKTQVIEYDNSERPLPNVIVAKVRVNDPQCSVNAYYDVRNEHNEVMATFHVKPTTKHVRFVLYPGSGSNFAAYPDDHGIYDQRATANVLGMGMPLTAHVSNTMFAYYERIGSKG